MLEDIRNLSEDSKLKYFPYVKIYDLDGKGGLGAWQGKGRGISP